MNYSAWGGVWAAGSQAWPAVRYENGRWAGLRHNLMSQYLQPGSENLTQVELSEKKQFGKGKTKRCVTPTTWGEIPRLRESYASQVHNQSSTPE